MNWRPHTEVPNGQVTALIATLDEDGHAHLLSDIYMRHAGYWVTESDLAMPMFEVFWWMPESEVLEGLPVQRGEQR